MPEKVRSSLPSSQPANAVRQMRPRVETLLLGARSTGQNRPNEAKRGQVLHVHRSTTEHSHSSQRYHSAGSRTLLIRRFVVCTGRPASDYLRMSATIHTLLLIPSTTSYTLCFDLADSVIIHAQAGLFILAHLTWTQSDRTRSHTHRHAHALPAQFIYTNKISDFPYNSDGPTVCVCKSKKMPTILTSMMSVRVYVCVCMQRQHSNTFKSSGTDD